MAGFDRRTALGGAVAWAAASAISSAPSPVRAAPGALSSRKMVIRADDVGHSPVCNIGTFQAIDHGLVTAADIMLDSPGSIDALERLRHYPWLSIGWHMHFWGTPLLPAARVASLVEHGGPFAGRFRTDLLKAADVVGEEAIAELRAQLALCEKILGRVPDTGKLGADSPFGRAINAINREAGIASGYATVEPTGAAVLAHIREARARGEAWATFYPANGLPGSACDPRWADRKILQLDGTAAYAPILTDSESALEEHYDPVLYYTEDRGGILKTPADVITVQAWHPGFVDYYVYRLGERANRPRARQFTVSRTQDVAALCDPRLDAWIRDQRIELVNQRDALYGTREFQSHLRAVGSDLAIG